MTETAPTLSFETQEAFHIWLKDHYTSTIGLWIKFAKKNSGIHSITPDEALELALCYGWIDGQRKPFDEQYYLNKYTPRRKTSLWSKRNCALAEQLIKTKKMQASGLAEIDKAKADGRWERAYDNSKNMEVPQDFLEILAQNKKALAFYQNLNRTNIFAIVFRLQTAKKPETRAKRLSAIIDMLEKGEKFH